MCQFPAEELLHLRRELGKQADAEPAYMQYVVECMKSIDDLRWAHTDLTGCYCWARAIDAADRPCQG
jgi:hypothetical protein